MYDQVDLRKCKVVGTGCPGNMMHSLLTVPEFSIFSNIVKRARLETIFNSPKANFTVFVPTNNALNHYDPTIEKTINIGDARHFVRSLTLKRRIPYALLQSSPASKFTTMDSPNDLYVTTIRGVTSLSNCSECTEGVSASIIVPDIILKNGIMHAINGTLQPIYSTQLR